MYFDTHAHYDDKRFSRDRLELLKELPQKGISIILNPGANIGSSREAVKIAERLPHVYAAVGVHPHDAKELRDGDMDILRELSKSKKVKAVGEIGLDYHYDHSPRDIQKKRFTEQLELARELGLPVIIHDREAHADCLEILNAFKDLRAVYHCYSGSLEYAKTLVEMGHYLSFTGAITYKNARHAIETIAWMPSDRIMIETDAPYLAPEPFRGERNHSGFVPIVAEKIAEIRGESVEEIAALTMENGKRFFGIE